MILKVFLACNSSENNYVKSGGCKDNQ
jgi:hypothetical protein